MGFISSKRINRARKEHTCLYCKKTINVGESYTEQCVIHEGQFQSYKLCDRCKFLCEHYFTNDDELEEFIDLIVCEGLMPCPKCGSTDLSAYELSADKMSSECECDRCFHVWRADLSLDTLKEIISKQKPVKQKFWK